MAAAAEKVALNSDLTPKPISFASMWIAQYLAFGLSPHSVMGQRKRANRSGMQRTLRSSCAQPSPCVRGRSECSHVQG